MPPIRHAPLDLQACESEPIAFIGAMQAPYHLIVLSRDGGRIVAATDGIEHLLGVTDADLDTCPPHQVLGPEAHAWMQRMMHEKVPGEGYLTYPSGQAIRTTLTPVGDAVGLLLDPTQNAVSGNAAEQVELLTCLRQSAAALREGLSGKLAQLAAPMGDLAQMFRGLCGFDRVMVYHFDADMNGEIVAESHDDRLTDSYLGLTFPSSDIPQPARALFLRNRVRPVIDIQAPDIALRSRGPQGLAADRIDLSACPFRAVSPVHVSYLTNMGVRATLTIALIVRGELWGLLTCHHYSGPRQLSHATLAMCHAFCDLASMAIAEASEHAQSDALARTRNLLRDMRHHAVTSVVPPTVPDLIARFAGDLLDLMHADGAIVQHAASMVVLGHVPGEGAVRDLTDRLGDWSTGLNRMVTATNHLAGLWPDMADALLPTTAGALAAFSGDHCRGLIALRRAEARLTTWGGDPYKRVVNQPVGGKLHPRASFEAWQEHMQDRCSPWSKADNALVADLAAGLDEVLWALDRRMAERDLIAARDAAQTAQAEVEHAAFHDVLTGLPNRRALARLLGALAGATEEPDRLVAALHIDLDRFKQINDTMGHAAGDAVLSHVAQVLNRMKRVTDVAFRIGGDEFLIIVPRVTDTMALGRIADRIIEALSRPLEVNGETCRFGASVGIATERAIVLQPETLLARADIALYESKENGRGRYTFVSDQMEERRRHRRALGEDILRALDANEFDVWYQMQFDAQTLAPSGAEALIRWHHPQRGLVQPGDFVSGAEEVGVIEAIDRFVMTRALLDRAAWARAGYVLPCVSVNVSARRLRETGLLESVRALHVPPGVLVFELLETIDLQEIDQVSRWNIDALRELGVKIEIDDFGTGHTSIVSLVQLVPDAVKIDRALIRPLGLSDHAAQLVAAILVIARTLGIAVIAEGVETQEQIDILRNLGCDKLQGYGLARPMPADRIVPFLSALGQREAAI